MNFTGPWQKGVSPGTSYIVSLEAQVRSDTLITTHWTNNFGPNYMEAGKWGIPKLWVTNN